MRSLLKNSLLAAVVVSVPAFATPTPITSCGTIITQPGHYALAVSLLCANDPTKPAISVKNTKDVTIRMNGRSISFLIKKKPFPPFPPIFPVPKAIGILVSDSEDVEIKGDGNLSFISKAATAVMARNSEEMKVEELTLKNSKVGVSFQGPQSEDGKVEEVVFSQNGCDVQVKLGAESPDVDDSNAQSYCQ